MGTFAFKCGRKIMKKSYFVAVTLVSIVSPLYSTPLLAASASVPTMDDVVVTASRIAESKKEVSASITVITSEEIRQSPSSTVADLLAEKNIGHIQKYPGNLTSIGIRGFRTDTHGNDLQGHVLILLDGRRAGSGNVSKFLTKNVERIEVIRGPGAVQYGSAGMGGVVNIITKQGQKNSMFVEAGAGSYDRSESSIGGEVKKDKLDFSGSYTYATSDDYETGSGETFYNTGVDYETGLSANIGYSFADNQRLGLIFTRFDVSESGSPEYISLNDLDDYTDKNNYSADLRYTGANAHKTYQWMARYFIGKDENSWYDPTASNPSMWDDGLSSSNETDQMGAQIQVTRVFEVATLTAGFDWLSYDVLNSWTPEETEYDNPALFLLGKSTLPDTKLTINYGLRYDWYKVQVSEPASRDEDQSRLTPLIGAAYQATETVKFRAQYAQGFVMPSADQLAADYTSWGSQVVGNADLDPEKSSTYEAGIDISWRDLTASATYFYSDYEDKIITDYLEDGSQSWQNLGDATIAGLETEIAYDIGSLLGWQWEVKPYLNMTILTEYEDDETGEDLQYVSGTTLSSGMVVNNGDGIFAKLNVTHTSSQDIQDYEASTYPTPVVELDSFTLVDLSAAWKFYEDDDLGAFTVRGEVTNIFDEEYAFVKGYPMPGRGFFVSLRWDY
jgi:vitamin B12 transporter